MQVPYRSAKQRRYMHAKHPRIARRWDRQYGAKVGGGKTKRQRRKRNK